MVKVIIEATGETLEDAMSQITAGGAPVKKTVSRSTRKPEQEEETEDDPAPKKKTAGITMTDLRKLLQQVAEKDRKKVVKYLKDNYDVDAAADVPKDQFEDFHTYLTELVGE